MSQLNIPNLDRLISHLEGLPEERFDIRWLYSRVGLGEIPAAALDECGTAACIAGWCNALSGDHEGDAETAGDWLNIPFAATIRLFVPMGYHTDPELFSLSRAIRTLKHMRSEYLRTGQVVVDWDAPEPVTKAAWTAPRAVEQAKPALPAEIVRFLNPSDLEVSA